MYQIIDQIHAAPQRLVLEFAGAGSLGLWWLHSVAGSSRTILEATDRYTAASLADLLGTMPETFVTLSTARQMAQRAYWRAIELNSNLTPLDQQAGPVLGAACTAAIATDHPKRGEHRVVVAVRQALTVTLYQVVLAKGQRDRVGEETVVGQLLLQAIARACCLQYTVPLDLLPTEAVEEQHEAVDEPLVHLLSGAAPSVIVHPDGQQNVNTQSQRALLSGAFNPLHTGHLYMAAAAAEFLGRPVSFELPVVNADKGTITMEELARRLHQFTGQYTVVLSRAALFVDKAALFPRCVFVVGYDTAVRLVDPGYYGDVAAMHAALDKIRQAGCRFLVAGRKQDDTFLTLADIDLPPDYANVFTALPQALFREDISSTELRDQAQRQSFD